MARGKEDRAAKNTKRGPDFGSAYRNRTMNRERPLATNRLAALHERHDAEETEAEKCRYCTRLRNGVAIVVGEVRHSGSSIASPADDKVLGDHDALRRSGQYKIRREATRGWVVNKKVAVVCRKADRFAVVDLSCACDRGIVQLDMNVS